MIGYLTYKLYVFTFVGVQHCFTNSGYNFVFIEPNNTSISFNYCLYHDFEFGIIDC